MRLLLAEEGVEGGGEHSEESKAGGSYFGRGLVCWERLVHNVAGEESIEDDPVHEDKDSEANDQRARADRNEDDQVDGLLVEVQFDARVDDTCSDKHCDTYCNQEGVRLGVRVVR